MYKYIYNVNKIIADLQHKRAILRWKYCIKVGLESRIENKRLRSSHFISTRSHGSLDIYNGSHCKVKQSTTRKFTKPPTPIAQGVFLADDRLLAWYCRLSVCLSVTLCTVA